jgi:hypothetical protein
VVYQLENLRKSNFQIYKNDSSSAFKNETWFSALPTDSQVNKLNNQIFKFTKT